MIANFDNYLRKWYSIVMKNKKLLTYSIFALFAFGGIYVFSGVLLPRYTVNYITRASRAGDINIKQSYVIGSKLLCKADGQDKCKVNVFIADENGLAIEGKQVRLNGADNISPIQGNSDRLGMVAFDIASKQEGQYELSAVADGKKLDKTVTVTFRN